MLNFDDYIELLDRQKNNQDVREEAIQYNVIRVFLQSIFQEFDIEATSKQERASIHNYLDYCGSYIDEKTGRTKKWTPDLVIAKNWNWDNVNNNVEYKCVVEVKSPFLDPITGQNPEKYGCLDEVKSHLKAQKNNKVILTDGVTWVFYDKEHSLNPLYDPSSSFLFFSISLLLLRFKPLNKFKEFSSFFKLFSSFKFSLLSF